MAKTGAAQLITDILFRMGRYTAGVPERADVLRQLNISNREVLTKHSLRFMLANSTLSVVSSTVAIPATIDPSKTMTLSRPSLDGEIVYVEVDGWYNANTDTYGQGSVPTEPTIYTVIGSNFVFKPAGLTATVPYIAQLRVVALTDDANSFSQLPEGWEETLLSKDAEAELRGTGNEPRAAELKAEANAQRELLYASERTSKEVQKVDREQKERAISRKQLSDEAEP